MFVVRLKPKPPLHLSYGTKRMKLQQNLTTRKRRIFFKNNLLMFLQKNRMLKCLFSIKKTEVYLPNIIITEGMVRNEILKLNVNKSCGPDKIHPLILIELVYLVTKPLALLNKTMDEGCIPQDWKMAYISPIFKKGARNKAENYRPISLAFKSFVKESMLIHMRAENLLSSKHYGFINGRSTTTQLLSHLDKCIDTIVYGGVVDTIYFDFPEALDKVPQ